MWHGWLGQQLKSQDARLYDALYHEHASQQPKAYLIKVANDYRQTYQAGDLVSFEIVLLGKACLLGERLVQAITTQPLKNLGSQQARVQWQSLASVMPRQLSPSLHTTQLVHWLPPSLPQLYHEVALNLLSPLRIKYQGNILQSGIPSLILLATQSNRRLALLCEFWCDDSPALLAALREPIVLGDHQTSGSITRFEDWQRYSVRQQESLPFGGLVGQLCYQGDIAQALPWLQVAEPLHLGGKTTFGLGHFQLIH